MDDERKPLTVIYRTRSDMIFDSAIGYGSLVAFIGLGIILDNPPMQWAGFVLGVLSFMGLAMARVNRGKCTIAEARKRLDEFERQGEQG